MFALDASVALRWLLNDASAADQKYCDAVMGALATQTATVPALWFTEIVHVLRNAEKANKVSPAETAAFLGALQLLPIRSDATPPGLIQINVAAAARQYRLSGYDAQYLELAMRKTLPLATLDRNFRKAMRAAGVPLFARK